jgi:hypothetical protein
LYFEQPTVLSHVQLTAYSLQLRNLMAVIGKKAIILKESILAYWKVLHWPSGNTDENYE